MTDCENCPLRICKNCAFWKLTHRMPDNFGGIASFGGCEKLKKPMESNEECHRFASKGGVK